MKQRIRERDARDEGRHEPDREAVESLLAALRREPGLFAGPREMAEAAGVGSAELAALLERHVHASPAEVLARSRVAWARRRLLKSSSCTPSEVALKAGFPTLSAFEKSFRRLTRTDPATWARLRGAEELALSLPRAFPARRILSYLGRDPDGAAERVRGRHLLFGILSGEETGHEALRVEVEVGAGAARARLEPVSGTAVPPEAAALAHEQILRLLGLEQDPKPFERRMATRSEWASLVAGRRGLTIPQTRDVFDALVWVIAGQQVSVPVALAMRRRLVRRVGVPVGGEVFTPPRAIEVARLEEAELRALGFSRAKADYLQGVARAVAGGSLSLAELAEASASLVEETLLGVRGLGPWSVHYVMMRAFALGDCLPLGDVGLLRALERYFELPGRPDAERTRELMAPFAPFRSLATFHLWAWLEEAG